VREERARVVRGGAVVAVAAAELARLGLGLAPQQHGDGARRVAVVVDARRARLVVAERRERAAVARRRAQAPAPAQRGDEPRGGGLEPRVEVVAAVLLLEAQGDARRLVRGLVRDRLRGARFAEFRARAAAARGARGRGGASDAVYRRSRRRRGACPR
jgi:hypothetical protein